MPWLLRIASLQFTRAAERQLKRQVSDGANCASGSLCVGPNICGADAAGSTTCRRRSPCGTPPSRGRYPPPPRSRQAPCGERCGAARTGCAAPGVAARRACAPERPRCPRTGGRAAGSAVCGEARLREGLRGEHEAKALLARLREHELEVRRRELGELVQVGEEGLVSCFRTAVAGLEGTSEVADELSAMAG